MVNSARCIPAAKSVIDKLPDIAPAAGKAAAAVREHGPEYAGVVGDKVAGAVKVAYAAVGKRGKAIRDVVHGAIRGLTAILIDLTRDAVCS